MRSSHIILFLLTVVSVIALSPEEQELWQDPQYVASLTNNNFLKGIKEIPYLLEKEYVFASIDTRLRDPDVIAYLNRDEKLLQYWGKKKGIEFDPGAGFTKYEKGYITTKGKSVVFQPEDMLGARVLNDGSVMFGSAQIEQGKVAKSFGEEVMVQGTVVDTRTKTRFSADEFNIGIGIDRYSIRETVAVTTVYGSYTLNSKQWFKVEFDGENPSVSGTNVEIVPEQDENAFTLEKGSAILYDNERFGLDANTQIRFGDALTGRETDVFAVTNTIKVDKPAHFCFTECNGIEHVLPEDYHISSIEVLRNRKFGDNEPVDRLKITARDTTNIDVNLQNTNYESIYADAHHGGRITVVQHGKNVVPEATATSRDGGFSTIEYYSEAVISPDVDGGVKVKGEDSKQLGGSTLLVPSKDVSFKESGTMILGHVKKIEFTTKEGITSATSEEFNIREYHQGKPLDTWVRSLQDYFPSGYDIRLNMGGNGGQFTPEQIAQILRRYAQENDISVDEVYKLYLKKKHGRLDMIRDWEPDLAQQLDIDAEKLYEELAIETSKEAVRDKTPLQIDNFDHAMRSDVLSDDDKRVLAQAYFEKRWIYDFDQSNGVRFDFLETYKPYLLENDYKKLVRFGVDKNIQIFITEFEKNQERTKYSKFYLVGKLGVDHMRGSGVFTDNEIREIEQRLEQVFRDKAQPEKIYHADSNYIKADQDHDGFVTFAEGAAVRDKYGNIPIGPYELVK